MNMMVNIQITLWQWKQTGAFPKLSKCFYFDDDGECAAEAFKCTQIQYTQSTLCKPVFNSRYEVQLHPGQLTLIPFRSRVPTDGEMTPNAPLSIVIHLSDGDTSVQKPPCPDAFTLITHKNKYQ